jgi:hypothetical protein
VTMPGAWRDVFALVVLLGLATLVITVSVGVRWTLMAPAIIFAIAGVVMITPLYEATHRYPPSAGPTRSRLRGALLAFALAGSWSLTAMIVALFTT